MRGRKAAKSAAINRDKIPKIYRGVEQLVARWAHNPKVTGSSPVPATINPSRKPRETDLKGFFVPSVNQP